MSMKATNGGARRSIPLPRSASNRLSMVYAFLLVILAVGAASSLPKNVRSGVEALVLGLAVAALVVHPSIASILRATSVRARCVAACLVLALVVSHVAKVTAVTFPFVDWRMFGRSSQGEPNGLRFVAKRADGSSDRIVLGASISDATVSRLDGMVRKQLESNRQDRLQQIIDAAIELEALDETKSPPVSVLINQCTAAVERPEVTKCTLLRTIPVNPSRSR